MELEHSFTVPVPKERAWDVLLDVERVAPCMPGATLDSVDGDEIRGRIKVKVGPISMTYAGTAKIVERDEKAGIVRLDASGKETRGAGTASASVRSLLEDRGQQTQVTVLTTLNVTGKPAQFGRGVMNEVSGKLLTIFATNLAAMLSEIDEPADAAASASAEVAASASASAEAAASAGRPAAGAGGILLDDLRLPARAVASLNRDGITTVQQLAGKTEHEVLAIDGIGPASVEDIKAKLAEHGLAFGAGGGSGTAGAGGGGGGASGAQAAEALSGVSTASPAGAPSTAEAPTSAGSDSGGTGSGGTGSGGTGSGGTGSGATDSGGTGSARAAAAAANGAAPSMTAPAGAGNGSRTGATAGSSRRPGQSAAHIEADSLNLIKVAGVPVLKRSLPVIAGVSVVVYFGLRRKMRKRNK